MPPCGFPLRPAAPPLSHSPLYTLLLYISLVRPSDVCYCPRVVHSSKPLCRDEKEGKGEMEGWGLGVCKDSVISHVPPNEVYM